jgi:hypothetical protein
MPSQSVVDGVAPSRAISSLLGSTKRTETILFSKMEQLRANQWLSTWEKRLRPVLKAVSEE